MTSRLRLAALAVAVAAGTLVAGCGAPAPTPAPATPAPAVTASPSATAGPSAVTISPSATAASAATVEDRSLLALLPDAIDGTAIVVEDGALEVATTDPDFTSSIAAAAFGTYVSREDLASAVVARPVEGVFSEAWFRDWRDSYDAGACDQAGGLVATAEAELGGRTVYVGTCAGGLHTFHAWIGERDLLVSAFAFGGKGYGEQLMEGLRP